MASLSEGFQPPYCFRPQLPVIGRGPEGGWVKGRGHFSGVAVGKVPVIGLAAEGIEINPDGGSLFELSD